MIFHYVEGALMCEARIPGLTQLLPEYNEPSKAYYDRIEHDEAQCEWCLFSPGHYHYYGGYRYFVAETVTRKAAQMIVDALGGYLVPERIPPSRQLGTGGPFYIHRFSLRSPELVAKYGSLFDATAEAGMYAIRNKGERFRVYDNSGFMIGEYQLRN